MGKLLSLKIDVTKIDKSRLFRGEKGTYLDLTVSIDDTKDQYGNDVSAWQSQTKEEREAKAPKLFLGNGKVFWSGEPKPQPADYNPDNLDEETVDDLPF